MNFLLPTDLPATLFEELGRASVAGGYDNSPGPTEVRLQPGRMVVRRALDESGYLLSPWDVDGAGRLMTTTATLMEREAPYHVAVELARGKVNQLRCQASDWRMVGLQIAPEIDDQIREASLSFGRAVTHLPADEAIRHAQDALAISYRTAEQLVQTYVDQFFQARHQRQPALETMLAGRVSAPLTDAIAAEYLTAFNGVCLPFNWRDIEPAESQYSWDEADRLLDWARERQLRVTAGPLIDFSSRGLPDWLWLWEGDLSNLASFMCDYVGTAVARYRGRIQRWQLTAGSNNTTVLSLGEDDLLWLTQRLAEAAWQIDPTLELSVGIAQPWGEYLTEENHTYSPFLFVDTLLRSGLRLAALDLEIVMGVAPRGSYCRDLLDTSRLLDLFALLGTPLQVTLGYPSADGPDSQAAPDLRVCGAGHWHAGFDPEVQAGWAAACAALAVCKPFVRGVTWVSLADAIPHLFPHCGLLDPEGRPKPALDRLRLIRQAHLK